MKKFYTRTGDDGKTGLLGEGRVAKDSPRIEAVGSVDEANAALGAARAVCRESLSQEIILGVQRDLYGMMGEITATPENADRFQVITAEKVERLEVQIGQLENQIEIPKEFIVPGDTQAGAALDIARTAVRRAERRVTHVLLMGELDNALVQQYLNRLSSLCFVLELFENQAGGHTKPTLAKG